MIDKSEAQFKNLQYVTDNLLLSLRMAKKYIEAIDVLNQLNGFLIEFDLGFKYIELIVLNWFKIKHDVSKLFAKSNGNKIEKQLEDEIKYKSINKLLKSIRTDSIMDYLFEELRLIKYFSTSGQSIQIYDEMLYVLNEIDAVIESSSNDKTIENRLTTNK